MANDDAQVATNIRDVARLAGVSTSTVSRVLNGHTGNVTISAATAERVRRATTELHYRPNMLARGLRTARTETIGAIVHNLLHPFTAELLRVIYAACDARGYHLLVGHAAHRSSEGQALGDILRVDHVEGLLLIGDTLREPGSEVDMAALVRKHRHVVSVACRPSVAGERSIIVDNAAGITMALDYLVGLGHRCIAYVYDGRSPISWEDRQRRAAYRRFLRSRDLPWTAAAECAVPGPVDETQAVLQRLLAGPMRPSAICAGDDMTAIRVLKAALTSDLRVPDDFSLTGFDDIPFAALCTPGLTTVHQPIEAMGQYAIDALFDQLDRGEAASAAGASANHVFRPTLVRRESCQPAQVTTPLSGVVRKE